MSQEASTLDFVVTLVRRLFNNESITEQDDFFEQGGDSIAAIDFIALVQQEYGIKLDLVTLFEQRQLYKLADIIMSKIQHGH
ncbi:acyl carrier protein [bacterium]|nr:acyl carrier protein [bacterium]